MARIIPFMIIPDNGSEDKTPYIFLIPHKVFRRELTPLYKPLEAGDLQPTQIWWPNTDGKGSGTKRTMWVDGEAHHRTRPINEFATALHRVKRSYSEILAGIAAIEGEPRESTEECNYDSQWDYIRGAFDFEGKQISVRSPLMEHVK